MSHLEQLVPGEYYHIYNRGNNRENLFREARNYDYFMRLYSKYVSPVVELYAFCLLRNHFHLLIRIHELEALRTIRPFTSIEEAQDYVSLQFSNWFSTYTKSINKAYGRSGNLFMRPFKRKRVESDRYFQQLVIYIHRNPQTHGLATDFRAWPYSSYGVLISDRKTVVRRAEVLAWFDGSHSFTAAHHTPDEPLIRDLLFDEVDE
jgi:putative transposase